MSKFTTNRQQIERVEFDLVGRVNVRELPCSKRYSVNRLLARLVLSISTKTSSCQQALYSTVDYGEHHFSGYCRPIDWLERASPK